MRVSLFSTAVLMLTLIAAGGSALACDCLTPPESERFKNAAVVFEGEVIYIAHNRQDAMSPLKYVFRVTKTLKGKPVPEQTIFAGWSDCDASFEFGGVYKVYAFESEGTLTSYNCSGNEFLYQKTLLMLAGKSSSDSVWQLWYVKALALISITVFLTWLIRYTKAWYFPA